MMVNFMAYGMVYIKKHASNITESKALRRYTEEQK